MATQRKMKRLGSCALSGPGILKIALFNDRRLVFEVAQIGVPVLEFVNVGRWIEWPSRLNSQRSV